LAQHRLCRGRIAAAVKYDDPDRVPLFVLDVEARCCEAPGLKNLLDIVDAARGGSFRERVGAPLAPALFLFPRPSCETDPRAGA